MLPLILQSLLVPADRHHMESDVPSGLHAKGGMRPGEADPLEPKRHSGKVHYLIVYKEVGDGLHSVELMSTVFEYLSEVIRGVYGFVRLYCRLDSSFCLQGSPLSTPAALSTVTSASATF